MAIDQCVDIPTSHGWARFGALVKAYRLIVPFNRSIRHGVLCKLGSRTEAPNSCVVADRIDRDVSKKFDDSVSRRLGELVENWACTGGETFYMACSEGWRLPKWGWLGIGVAKLSKLPKGHLQVLSQRPTLSQFKITNDYWQTR